MVTTPEVSPLPQDDMRLVSPSQISFHSSTIMPFATTFSIVNSNYQDWDTSSAITPVSDSILVRAFTTQQQQEHHKLRAIMKSI
ncbi:unnamed protein product [Didymodactylos carnosus]|uniref:Uncharacterized protein n=1 Tax=Didymodactylos carnosus TaxID=1234261 RepID=A0A8S2E4U9_9BILA|nr:unnamed protein product [Didymodactylos carnosus]CAF3902037.1 unnamed protein product [Didymodactylos carnosus]